ncbi:RNA polymerase sigma factor [Promicromonospora iranensis]|uniref:RNA polymerase sigma factor (Sigma-70 family) n=1 Tax=Promicromonospora iranensis TaxID=1105144 RepID=A0ABU2CNL7_9MICO|nr:sigma-70 family RNA polymerase sigma factor [Promicromonospora iranensis]MDR7382932.1 RNA polymerase sigma factor (sigma-70 family) [Promicromonospora iranensis]
MAQWEAELTELATSRGGALVGYAYSLCRDRARAEDLVQDALVKVFSRLRRPHGSADGGQHVVDLDQPQVTNAEGYVRRAILTIYLDGYRRQNHWSGLKHLLADDELSPGADRVATARVDVGVALAQLSTRQREAVVLRFFEDMTVPQIATALGTRPGTIKRYLSDAMELLRVSLAEIVTPDVDTALDERLDAVAGAVRRRRTAKVGAVAGMSMVLAVVLAWGAFSVKPWIRSEPLPAEDKIEYTPGYVPASWHEDVGIYCGMPVEELEAMDTGTLDVEIAGDLVPDPQGTTAFWSLPVTISGEVPDGMFDESSGYMTWPLIVWTHEGRIVDLPDYWREAANDEAPPELVEHGTWTGLASTGNASTCRADTLVGTADVPSSYYDNERAGGRYELMVIVADPHTGDDPELDDRRLLVSDPVTVDLDSGVAPPPEFAPPSDDCSGAAYAGRELVAPGAPAGVRDTAARLLEAVTTCDERLVVELAGNVFDTASTFQTEVRSVNEVFALPETGGRTPYATIARLLTETQPVNSYDGGSGTWPRVTTFLKSETAWQEAIDAGAVSSAQADADRAAGRYSGWQLSIQDPGMGEGHTWETFYEGYDPSCNSAYREPPPECADL